MFFEMLLLDPVCFSALALLGIQKARGKPAALSPLQDQVLFSSSLLFILLGRKSWAATPPSTAHFSEQRSDVVTQFCCFSPYSPCKRCNLWCRFLQDSVIIVSNPRKWGIEFIGVAGLVVYRDVLQCRARYQYIHERRSCRAMKRQQKGRCPLSLHRQVLHDCWRELISSLFLCNPTGVIWCSFLGDCLLERFCQRSEGSGNPLLC